MKAIKNVCIVVGLFMLSQVSMTTFGIVKYYYLEVGETYIPSLIAYGLIAMVLINIGLSMWIAKKLNLASFRFDWSTKKNWLWIVGAFVLGRIIAIVGTSFLQANTGQQSTANDALINNLFIGENPLLIFLLIAVAAPVMEEIVFRGGIIGLLFEKYQIVGIVVSVVLFGLAHTATSWIEFVIYALIGLLMALVYVKTKRLEAAIAVHFLNNVLGAIVLMFL
ncbi:CPBP family intramembrane glutamic endopeptidase [Enterococcus sp. DIV0876]|uniref:CPBP family intramembrane glutamic endopeptidase n=1 Tax=Enterococcus sp. DIV0876 TaxID=2774633 RepID=UPI003D2FC6EE